MYINHLVAGRSIISWGGGGGLFVWMKKAGGIALELCAVSGANWGDLCVGEAVSFRKRFNLS